MNEMELVELFVPCTSVEILILLKLKNVSSCSTAITRTCMPCRWWWHSLFALTRQVPQRFAMHCWKDCADEKKNKSC